ncbi:MAG: carboxypeptidase [Oscillospiraceae bacterium]|nr:carboxypeptidase [Oscillospiraceae bacterium]
MEIQRPTARPRGCDGARIIAVIRTTALRGLGTENDPVREVIQYWDLDGNLLAEKDPVARETILERK